MPSAFADIDPYAVLEVAPTLSPLEIKKSYKSLCLKYHPDKIQQTRGEPHDPDLFPRIQFAYSILSDPQKRQHYDSTGSFSDSDDVFDWKLFFDSFYGEVSVERIEEDKKIYQNSEEERRDIVANFIHYDGDFLKLFETIPHLDFTESEEDRVFKIIEKSTQIKGPVLKAWEKYKRSRKTRVKNMLKKLAKEAREAAEWERKHLAQKTTKQGLAQVIKSRQSSRLDTLISSLEQKYGQKHGEKRGLHDIDDAEFERVQSKIMAKRKKKC